jgi:hypothetical protein
MTPHITSAHHTWMLSQWVKERRRSDAYALRRRAEKRVT